MEIAVVGAAAAVTLNGDGDVEACRVALTAVAPTIVRSPSAEAAIVGKPVNEETLAAVAAGASADASPISDVRAGERLPPPHRRRHGPPGRRGRGRPRPRRARPRPRQPRLRCRRAPRRLSR